MYAPRAASPRTRQTNMCEADEMAFRFRDLSLNDYTRLIGAFVLPLSIGIAARLWYPVCWWPHEVAQSLADALIIAGIIGILIDLFAAKFLIEKVADDLAQRLVGRGLPEELQGHIGKIVKTSLVRDHYEKTYYFHDPDSGRVNIDITITFEVRNYSDKTVPYAPDMDERVVLQPRFLYLEYGLNGKDVISLDRQSLERQLQSSGEGIKKVAGEKKVSLKPFQQDPSAVCKVR